MSESEAYGLVMLIASELNTLMFGYFSMISAFLVMSYLVAEKLSSLHAWEYRKYKRYNQYWALSSYVIF